MTKGVSLSKTKFHPKILKGLFVLKIVWSSWNQKHMSAAALSKHIYQFQSKMMIQNPNVAVSRLQDTTQDHSHFGGTITSIFMGCYGNMLSLSDIFISDRYSRKKNDKVSVTIYDS